MNSGQMLDNTKNSPHNHLRFYCALLQALFYALFYQLAIVP